MYIYVSHRLYVFKIAALSGGVFQQTTALNNALALWVHACWHISCKCCEHMHYSWLCPVDAVFYLPNE